MRKRILLSTARNETYSHCGRRKSLLKSAEQQYTDVENLTPASADAAESMLHAALL